MPHATYRGLGTSLNSNRFKWGLGNDALRAGLPVTGLACLGVGLGPSFTVCDRTVAFFVGLSFPSEQLG